MFNTDRQSAVINKQPVSILILIRVSSAGESFCDSSGGGAVNAHRQSQETGQNASCGHLLWNSGPTQKNHHSSESGNNNLEYMFTLSRANGKVLPTGFISLCFCCATMKVLSY